MYSSTVRSSYIVYQYQITHIVLLHRGYYARETDLRQFSHLPGAFLASINPPTPDEMDACSPFPDGKRQASSVGLRKGENLRSVCTLLLGV